MRRRLIFVFSSCLAAGLGGASAACRGAAPAARHTADIVLPDDGRRLEGTVEPGDTFTDLLHRHQVEVDDRQAFLDAVEPAFSSRQLRAHHTYSLTLSPDFRVRGLTYRIDPDRFLQVEPALAAASAGKPAARFTTEVVTYRREVALVAIRGDVDRDHP